MSEQSTGGRSRTGRGRVTMADLAKAAGVSSQTVSRTLRSPDLVKPETRARVEAAAERLQYIPNNAASAFASTRSGLIGVLVPNAANRVFSEIVRVLSVRLNAMGYQTLLGHVGYDAFEEERLVRRLIGWSPDGVVLSGIHHSGATRRMLRDSGIPVVESFDLTVEPIGDVVGLSHDAMGYEMTRFLWAQGYRRIAFLGQELEHDPRARQRADGYCRAAGELGLTNRVRSIGPQGSFEAGASGLSALLAEAPDTDAAIFSSDVPAAGAMFECQRRGWSVPDRIAIAGNGDFEISRALSPRLTTVHIPLDAIGETVADLLAARLQGERGPARTVDVGFRIRSRASTRRRSPAD